MSYELDIQESFPYSFDNLSGSRPPLVAGSGSSSLFISAHNFPFPIFTSSAFGAPFSMEVWYLPVNVLGQVVVMGHTNEGLIFDGQQFILQISSGGDLVRGFWQPTEIKAFHLVVVYDGLSFTLFADGARVLILDARLIDSVETDIVCNQVLTESATGIYDSLALYYRALSLEEIARHYFIGHNILRSPQIASAKRANTYSLAYQDVPVLDRVVFDSSNWELGLSEGIAFLDDLRTQISVGWWKSSIPLSAIVDGVSNGVHIHVLGKGFVLQYSLDGVNWIDMENNRTILEDLPITDELLYIQVSLLDTEAWISQIVVDIFGDRVMDPLSGSRDLGFKSVSFDQSARHQLDFAVEQGAKIVGGYLDILPDPADEPEPITSVEMWVRLNDTNGTMLFQSPTQYASFTGGTIFFTGMTVFMNGAALPSGANIVRGHWNHFVFSLGAPTNDVIRIADNLDESDNLDVSVASLSAHVGSVDPSKLYQYNIGANVVRVDETDTIVLTESGDGPDIYAYTWTESRN